MRKILGRKNYDKGIQYEKDFGEYLKTSLGYKIVKYREKVFDDHSKRDRDCDIHATIDSKEADNYYRKSLASFLCGIVITIGSMISGPEGFLNKTSGIDGLLTHEILTIIAFVSGIYFGWLTYQTRGKILHVWIECKNLSETVKRDKIMNLKAHVDEVLDSEIHAEWSPDKLIFASSSGYDIDAKIYADKYDIELYEGVKGDFKRIN